VGGDYKNYNMTALNLTIVRDYVFYLALKSAGQGVGEEVTDYLGNRDYHIYSIPAV
jgi:hypothetical protein